MRFSSIFNTQVIWQCFYNIFTNKIHALHNEPLSRSRFVDSFFETRAATASLATYFQRGCRLNCIKASHECMCMIIFVQNSTVIVLMIAIASHQMSFPHFGIGKETQNAYRINDMLNEPSSSLFFYAALMVLLKTSSFMNTQSKIIIALYQCCQQRIASDLSRREKYTSQSRDQVFTQIIIFACCLYVL